MRYNLSMRIACVHVPQLSLQSLSRIDASLRGAAVAVVGAGAEPASGVRPSLALHSPIVLACSRAAWLLGVRLGMTASAARFVASELRVVSADAQREHDTVRAIADALLGLSPVVDIGGRVAERGAHLAMYCEVPSKARGTTFGGRVIELLGAFGITARVGIADDRFTAWVAAAHGSGGPGLCDERGVVSVPRGGSAAFLAPRPLSLLAITPEVLHMLESLGVRTLGEFAALPAPSVSRPLEADYQALARGDGGSALRPYAPEAPIREELVAGDAGSLFGGVALVATLARRVALRLAGRARGAARLDVTITGADSDRVVQLTAGRAASSQRGLVELIAPLVERNRGPVAKLRVVVAGEAIAGAVAGASAAPTASAVPGEAVPVDALDHEAAGSIANPLGESPAGSAAAAIDVLAAALSPPRGKLPRPGALAPSPSGSPNGLSWQLIDPQGQRIERRDVHRRTRRARPRRRAVVLAQSQLFGNLDR